MAASVTTVASLAAAATVPAILALGKFAGLRDALYTKWAKRIDLASAGLTERAIALLRRLQAETDELLGSAIDIDPAAALQDPEPLARITSNFHRTIRVRRLLPRRFKALVRMSLGAPVLAVAYILGVWAVAAHYARWLECTWLREVGFWVAGLSLGGGFAMVLATFYLEQRLTTADMMSQPAGTAAKRGEN